MKKNPQKTYYILIIRKNQSKNKYKRLKIRKVETLYISMENNIGKFV